jgi:hypothetical protein
MSQAINTYLVNDDRLDIKDHINFSVLKGAQSVNQQQFVAQSAGVSNINFSCLIPSLTTLIDRHVMIKSTFQITVSGNMPTSGQGIIEADLSNFCLSNFPFSNLINTCQVQLNNTTLNTNYQDTLDLMLRLQDQEALDKYSDLTPTQFDTYLSTGTAGSLSAFNNIDEAYNYPNLPRGAFLKASDVVITTATSNGGVSTAVVTVSVCESLMVSPFVFGDSLDGHNSAISGVSAININLNLNSSCARAVRYKNVNTATNLSVNLTDVSQGSTQVLFTLMNAKPSQMIPLTCVLPYYELPVFKTQQASQTVAIGATFNITSTVVSPNCVPDNLYLFVRNNVANRVATDNEAYYPIVGVNITWNTQSGILANCKIEDLYYLAKKAGIKVPFLQYRGGSAGASGASTPLNGSILALQYSTMIALIEDYYACSSLGSFNFSVNVTCLNNTLSTAVPATELNVVFMNSGLISTTAGTTNTFIGVLNKQEVLSVSQEEPVSQTENSRLVGGSWLSNLKSALPSLKAVAKYVAPAIKGALGASDSGVAKGAVSALGALGYGMTGGRKAPRTY